MELLVVHNPDPDSSLPYLLRVPLEEGTLVFRTKGTWPRTTALYCHPVPAEEWPDGAEVVERVALRACRRRGAAIDVIADRGREQRSQIVFTRARGREMVFWQSPRTRKQARPDVRTPTGRAAGMADLRIVVDAHERYPYTFNGRPVTTERRGLRCGDYAIVDDEDRTVAAVERKSLGDLVSSVLSGRLRFAMAELAALPHAAVVIEERYSKVFTVEHARPSTVLDGLAELQVGFPTVPLMFCETRKLAQEWTYRYLAAAHVRAQGEPVARERAGLPAAPASDAQRAASEAEPTSAQVRSWARERGMTVSDRGRVRAEVVRAWKRAHGDRTGQ